ncbi:MAG: hypothetical protein A3B25_00840 [Candidatus Ryanbacteria bacterium RIFCSPLOWO2_01_FULL_48_26]|uniref:Uncharacterized protein n=1 Tax=Candidatus Ryanbacteria bacterium RIFCSPLOWO2_01_FULL_48_26 TaxID=1802126 RepID=A0A1G2GR81_9BACT|nr:MAG: hypothetical protein A3B25_00840 [Candidatus Ryanbacteria bacterium RIFCSPLOWO2_01_FULL_48_26]
MCEAVQVRAARIDMTKSQSQPDQHFTLLSTLAANAHLGQFTTEQIQVGISEPERAGQEFALFVANGFRAQAEDCFLETNELTIQIPALPRPTLEYLQTKYGIMSIERDTSTTEPVILKLYTVLRPGEKNSISGPEYERRIAVRQNSLLGYQHRNWVVENQGKFPALKELLGKIYIDFPALIVVVSRGYRGFPYLSNDGERWRGRWGWVDDGFDRDGRVASK